MELKFPYGDCTDFISILDFTTWGYTIRSTTSLLVSRYDRFLGKPIKIIVNNGPMDVDLVKRELETIRKKYRDNPQIEIVYASDTPDLSDEDVVEIDVVEPVKYIAVDGSDLEVDSRSTSKRIIVFKRHKANPYFNALREITLKLEGKTNE